MMRKLMGTKRFLVGLLSVAMLAGGVLEPANLMAAEVDFEVTRTEEATLGTQDIDLTEDTEEAFEETEDTEEALEETEASKEPTEELNLEEIAVSGKCGDNAYFEYYWKGVSGVYDGTLVISGTGAIYDYSMNACPWKVRTINKVVINEGITYIGKYNFAEMEHMTSVKIPDSVKKIADWAFYGSDIDNLDLGNGVEEIGESAFEACHIKSLKMPTSLRKIGKGAFQYNELKNIEIPKGVVEIGEDAFRTTNEYFRNVTIPNTVEVIGSFAFYSYTGCNVTFEEGCKLKRLESGILYGTKNVVLPDSIEELAQNAINHVDVTSVTLNEGLKRIEDGALFNGITSIHIPASVEYIGNAFENDYLEKITFADNSNLQEISSSTFQSCRLLKEITIPASVKKIGAQAFYEAGLEKVKFEAGSRLEYIDEKAFGGCNFSEITIPDSVKVIGYQSINSQKELVVNFGEDSKLEYIDGKAFEPCSTMAGVTVNLSDKLINSKWVDNKGVEVDINLVKSGEDSRVFMRAANYVKDEDLGNIYAQGKCGEDAYWKVKDCEFTGLNGSTLKGYKLVLYGTGPMYDGAVIDYAPGLKDRTVSIEFEEDSSISYIGKHAFDCFAYSSRLMVMYVNGYAQRAFTKKLVIPGSVERVGSNAFSAIEIDSVKIEEGVKEIESEAFGFTNTVIIPSSVEMIGDYPFVIRDRVYFNPECKITHLPKFVPNVLNGFTIPNNVIEIRRDDLVEYSWTGGYAAAAQFHFAENSKCVRIDDFAFTPNSQSYSVYGPLPKNLEYIGSYALGHYSDSYGYPRTITIPDKVKYIGASAFSGSFATVDEIVLPEGLEYLGIQGYTVKKVNIPASLYYCGGLFCLEDITGSLTGWVDSETGKPVDLKTHNGGAYRSVGDKKVIGEIVKATSVTLDKTNVSLNKGETYQIVVTVKPDNASNKDKLVYSTGDASVATVSASGLVTAIGGGNTTITVTVADGSNKQAKLSVYVKPGVELTTLIAEKETLRSGETTRVRIATVPTGYIPLDDISVSAQDNEEYVSIIPRYEDGYVIVRALSTDSEKEVTLSAQVGGASANKKIKLLPSKIMLDYAGGSGVAESIDGVIGDKLALKDVIATKPGYLFDGWYTKPESKGIRVNEDTVMSSALFDGEWKLFAGYTQYESGKMTVQSLGDYAYTGSQIKPEVKVYDGDKLLTLNKDYTVKYVNNTNVRQYNAASPNAKLDPAAIITGKGNYSGNVSVGFSILPKNIADADVDMNEKLLVKAKTAKEQKLIPTVKWGKIVLKNNKDFTLEYPDNRGEAYKAAGQYNIVVKAKAGSNYTGERTVIMNIVEPAMLINKATVKLKNKAYIYTGEEIKPDELDAGFEVNLNKKVLKKGTDYRVSYVSNKEVGTASLYVIGIGDYSGTKTVDFKITGDNISKAKYQYQGEAKENVFPVQSYTGNEIRPDEKVSLYMLAGATRIPLIKGRDYEVSYLKNVNPGSAQMVITGKGKYAGTSKKISFKVGNATITDGMVTVSSNAAYSKGGAKADVSVSFGGKELTEGVDYTLKFVNNKEVTKESTTKQPAVTVTGKGNYKGSVTRTFKITGKELKDVNVTLADKVFKTGAKGYNVTKVTVTDTDGKVLAAKKDYVTGDYTYASETKVKQKGRDEVIIRNVGDKVEAEDIILEESLTEDGLRINVEIKAVEGSNYTGSAGTESYVPAYRVTKSDISKATVAKITMTYTGDEIKLTKETEGKAVPVDALKNAVSIKGADKQVKTLTYGKDFEIVEGSYQKNILKGAAKVTIRGLGEYGGSKVISFTIASKNVTR